MTLILPSKVGVSSFKQRLRFATHRDTAGCPIEDATISPGSGYSCYELRLIFIPMENV